MKFEEYLQQEFIKQFNGTKDQAEVAEEHWFEQLDVSELIDYGDDYGKELKNNFIKVISTHSEHEGSYCDTGEDIDWACRSDCMRLAIERLNK